MSQTDTTLPEQPTLVPGETAELKTLPGFLRQHYLLILMGFIVALAFGLRIYDLSGVPNGLNQDEAVNGVDAYSLGQTLRDHHGNFLPVLLEAFEDWASSGLTYLTVPFVWVLGLSEFSIRLPVVLLGTGSIVLMFLYVKRLTNRPNLGLLAAFLLAITPWSIMSSRWAIPPEIVPFFLLLLLYANARFNGAEEKLWKYAVVGLLAALLVYVYPTQKMFIPLLLGVLAVCDLLNKTAFKQLFRKNLVIGGVFLVVSAPIYYLAFLGGPKYNARFSSISVFTQFNSPFREILVRYINGFNPLHIFDWTGNFVFLAIFYYLGLTACIHRTLFRKSFFNLLTRQQARFIIGWWLVSPVAASFTVDLYNPLRVIHSFPLAVVFSVLGLAIVGDLLKTRFKKTTRLAPAFYLVIFLLSGCFLFLFSYSYYVQYKDSSKEAYQYGIGQFSNYLVQHKADFDSVTVDSHIVEGYIYYLFYSKKDPHQYNYAEVYYPENGLAGIRGVPQIDNYTYALVGPETIAGATELLTVKDESGFVYYRVYARGRQWYVQMEYDNNYEPPF